MVTVPARVLLSKPFAEPGRTLIAFAAAVAGLFVARWMFHGSLRAYRSASS